MAGKNFSAKKQLYRQKQLGRQRKNDRCGSSAQAMIAANLVLCAILVLLNSVTVNPKLSGILATIQTTMTDNGLPSTLQTSSHPASPKAAGAIKISFESQTPKSTPKEEEEEEAHPYYYASLPNCGHFANGASFIECEPNHATIDVILSAYVRTNLALQLEMIANQTVPVNAVYVVQNGDHYDGVAETIAKFQKRDKVPPIHHVHFHTSSMFHGRFHVGYLMSKAKYVSIWDDDLDVGPAYIETLLKVFAHLKDQDALVTSAGRILGNLPDPTLNHGLSYRPLTEGGSTMTVPADAGALIRVDFPMQSYHIRRELLRFFLGAPVYTYETGEDMQLAFALSWEDIPVLVLPQIPNAHCRANEEMGSRHESAASKQDPNPRRWLLCKLALEKFPFMNCDNCVDMLMVKGCTEHYEHLTK